MTTHVTGPAAARTAAPTARRCNLMDLPAVSPVITDAEYDTAMQRILACQDMATLQKWYRNTVCEIARLEDLEPATPSPIIYATATQKEEMIRLTNRAGISCAEKTAVLLTINRLTTNETTATIGDLWASILNQTNENSLAAVDSHTPGLVSYSNAV